MGPWGRFLTLDEVARMSSAPYEETFQHQGDLCFLAEVPALAHIGERFDQIDEEWLEYTASDEELERWRQFAARVGELMEQAKRGEAPDWATIETQLQESGDCLSQAIQRVAGPIHEYFETGQMPLPEYLEWILQGAETMWSFSGGGLDTDAFEARCDRLTARLAEAGYETESDRRMREEEPERYEFLAMFRQFIDRQDELRPQIEASLRAMHRWMDEGDPVRLPSDRVLFPENADATDVPLQCFQIHQAYLDPEHEGRIVLELDSQFGHFEEHGCCISIRDGAVESYGTWDDVSGDEEFDEED